MRAAFVLALLLLAPVLGASATQAPVSPDAPWWERTMLDLDGDRLDDALIPLLVGSDPLTVLVDYANMPTASQRAALLATGAVIDRGYQNFPILSVRATPATIRELPLLPGVVMVEIDDVIYPLLKESVPLTGAPQVWRSYGATGKGITVAVLDDGAFESHPDFDGKIAGHYDPTSPVGNNLPIGTLAPAGEEGHGTHVAGTIVGNGAQSGGTYKGVAPDAQFANVKVFSSPNSTSSTFVLDGLDWVISNSNRLNMRIASMSLGGRPSDGTDAISRAVNIAVDKGIIVVAAAGNAGDAPKTIASPGAAEKAITVGAVDKRKHIAPYSSRGPTLDGRTKPDLVAPGSDITSTVPMASTSVVSGLLSGSRETFYGQLSGTSMATPHVSGIVALMLEVNPDLSPIQVKRILLATAQDLGEPGKDNETGYGFSNAIAAVQVARDPTLLEQPRFQSILATIPDPPQETFMERLTFETQRLSQDRERQILYGGIGAAALVLIVLISAFRRR